MYAQNVDDLKIIGKDFYDVVGYFTIDGASAVLVQTPLVAQGAPFTVTKPAGTGIYRITLTNAANDVFWADAEFFVAAGTIDRDVQPVAKNLNAQNFVSSVDFQVRKTSDGTAVDPVTCTVQFRLTCKASSLRP